MVPFAGCPIVSADEVVEVPFGSHLRLRVGLWFDGEELWFDRKPFPLGLTLNELHKRFGPGRYVVALVAVDPTAHGSGIRGTPLFSKVVEIRARGADDVGDDPWPVNLSAPETPRQLIEEVNRRAMVRGEGDDGMGMVPGAGMGPDDPPVYLGGGGGGGGSVGGGNYRPMRGPPVINPMLGEPPQPAPYGYQWGDVNGEPVLVRSAQSPSLGSLTPPAPAPIVPPPPPSPFAALLAGRSPEEILALAMGAIKVVKEISGGADRTVQAEVERERIRQDYELRKQEMQQQHAMFLEQMRMQQAALAPREPVAPPVDVNAIRAAALAEARMESLVREQDRLRDELRAAKNAPAPAPQPDLLTQISKIKETASALGLIQKRDGAAAEAPAPPPSGLEQLADILDTAGGKVLVEKLAGKFLRDDSPTAPSPAPSPAAAPAVPPEQVPAQLMALPAPPPPPMALPATVHMPQMGPPAGGYFVHAPPAANNPYAYAPPGFDPAPYAQPDQVLVEPPVELPVEPYPEPVEAPVEAPLKDTAESPILLEAPAAQQPVEEAPQGPLYDAAAVLSRLTPEQIAELPPGLYAQLQAEAGVGSDGGGGDEGDEDEGDEGDEGD